MTSRYWRPDQHGAWPMIIAPLIIGLTWLVGLHSLISDSALGTGISGPLGTTLTAGAITVAWVAGYLTFFAGGKWLPARASGNTRIQTAARLPMLIYGAITAAAAVCALLLQPHLLWWVIVFAPLTLIAVWETWRGTPRSLVAGTAETVASAFVIPVLASAGVGSALPVVNGVTLTRNLFSADVVEALPPEVWVTAIWLALYQVGTVIYVKTMIRKRKSRPWFIGSLVFHAVALLIGFLTITADYLALLPWLLAVAVLGWSLWRAYAVPQDANSPAPRTTWTPKKVGLAEVPVVVGITVAGILAAVLYDGPLVIFVG